MTEIVHDHDEQLREELLAELSEIAVVFGTEFVESLKQYGGMNTEQKKQLNELFGEIQQRRLQEVQDDPEANLALSSRLAELRDKVNDVMAKLAQRPNFFT